jgi:DNA-binding NtrC family response regulator
MTRPLVLIVDDDDDVRAYLATLLSGRGYEVACAASGEQALTMLSSAAPPAVMLLDLLMPGMSGLELLSQAQRTHPWLAIVVLSTMGQIATVVEAVKGGASHYLTKPFQDQELELAIETALEKQTLRDEIKVLQRRLGQYTDAGELVLSSPRMLRIRELALQVADTDAPVLVLGESGVGKEVLARFIHTHSGRGAKRFVKVNCAALPQELLESELFGYERGAFSGAVRDKPGKFELADKGTILLDEIGEMEPNVQAKLLRLIQDGELYPVGEETPTQIDVRVLAATNRDLEREVADGRFRADLFWRLNVIQVELPSLRERAADIVPLAQHFMARANERNKRAVAGFDPPALALLEAYRWPGNIRELENVVERAVIMKARGTIGVADLPAQIRSPRNPTPKETPVVGLPEDGTDLRAMLEAVEARMIEEALERTNGNKNRAAELLGLNRTTLVEKLRRKRVA